MTSWSGTAWRKLHPLMFTAGLGMASTSRNSTPLTAKWSLWSLSRHKALMATGASNKGLGTYSHSRPLHYFWVRTPVLCVLYACQP